MPRKGYIPRGQRCPGRGYHMEASALKNLHVHEFNIKLKPQQSLFLERFALINLIQH